MPLESGGGRPVALTLRLEFERALGVGPDIGLKQVLRLVEATVESLGLILVVSIKQDTTLSDRIAAQGSLGLGEVNHAPG